MRTAFFGGSFDPPHLGHIAVACAALQALQLDEVLFAPVGLQPLKMGGSSATYEQRLAMTGLAIAEEAKFKLSEADGPGQPGQSAPNYTVDTLRRLRGEMAAGTQLFLLMGADSYRTLARWHRAEEIPYLANLIVAARPREDLSDLESYLPEGMTLSRAAVRGAKHFQRYLLCNRAGAQAWLYLLPNLNFEISATELRRQIQGHPTAQPPLLAPGVLAYIHEHGLYR